MIHWLFGPEFFTCSFFIKITKAITNSSTKKPTPNYNRDYSHFPSCVLLLLLCGIYSSSLCIFVYQVLAENQLCAK